MDTKSKQISTGKLLLMGGALFSMHFGGSSMIWPMTWGKESGNSVLVTFLGIYLTAVFFPLLGYVALARGEGTFYQISERVSKKFARIFCGVTILVLGPLFVIPRMSAAAWDAFLQITGYNPKSIIPALAFSVIYYIVVYWFMANKSDTVDKLSKILFPILLVTVIGVFTKGFISPPSTWVPKSYSQPPFSYGFIEGYATMELPCALVFAVIMINDLKAKGVSKEKLNKYLLIIGLIGTGILTITHFCHMLLGSLTGDLFKELKYSALYAQVVVTLWGETGGVIFNIGLLFAALTTAIGLTTATSEYFEETTKGKTSYKKAAIATLVVSAVVSTIGLENIVTYTAPLLDVIYPPAITITLYYTVIPNLIRRQRALGALKAGTIAAFGWGIFEGIIGYCEILKIKSSVLINIYNIFPLSVYGMGWVSIAVGASVLGYLFYSKNSKTVGNEIV